VSYKAQAILANNDQLLMRVAACASTQNIPGPYAWSVDHQWQLSAQPGWASAYATAVANNVTQPGNNEGVITDAMILSAVQAIIAEEASN
jgi:acid phosphatase family membrane protein YuiD